MSFVMLHSMARWAERHAGQLFSDQGTFALAFTFDIPCLRLEPREEG